MNKLPRFSGLAAFLLADAVLMLQVALTRVFAVMTFHHFTYLIIGLALLGFGAAGTVLTLSRRFAGRQVSARLLADCAWLFGLSTAASFLAITRTRFDPMLVYERGDFSQFFGLLMLLLFAVAPLFFGGLCLGYLVSKSGDEVNRIYFCDLVGAGCGSLGALAAINYLGAVTTIFGVAFVACVLAMLVGMSAGQTTAEGGRATSSSVAQPHSAVRTSQMRWRYPLTALVALALAAVPQWKSNAIPVPFPESKQMPNARVGEYRWHVVARVDVDEHLRGYPSFGGSLSRTWDETRPPLDYHGLYQDGSALTGIVRLEGASPAGLHILGHYMQGAAYVLRPGAEVLTIGPGGGVDVAMALYHGASRVVGVDLNPWTIDYVKNKYAAYAGGLYGRDDVEIVCAEGRHYLTAAQEKFDVIQLSGVDTFTALASGAYALSENYVYTREAMLDYFSRLKEGGIVSFSRWLFAPPRETLRLVMTARSALEAQGVTDAHAHFVVIAAPAWLDRSPWAETLVKPTPFTREELQSLRDWCERLRFDVLYDPFVSYEPGGAYDALVGTSKYDPVVCAREIHRGLRTPSADLRAYVDEYVYNVAPCTDDNPFFFNYYRFANLPSPFAASLGGDPVNRLPLGLMILLACLVQIVVIGGLLILWPMRTRAVGIRAQPGAWRVMIYFGCLGLGFVTLEIMLIQKLMVFLGGPVYAMAVTLFSLLVFSGIGSYVAKAFTRSSPKAGGLVVLLLLCAAIHGEVWFLNEMVPGQMGLSHVMRGAVAIAAILPLGLLLGMPFPTGLRLAERLGPQLTPWAWCVNACATVLGSVACILAAMVVGFTAVMYAALAVYCIALLALAAAPGAEKSADVY